MTWMIDPDGTVWRESRVHRCGPQPWRGRLGDLCPDCLPTRLLPRCNRWCMPLYEYATAIPAHRLCAAKPPTKGEWISLRLRRCKTSRVHGLEYA